MGIVYRAHDTLLQREVAIKFPSSAGHANDERQRLLREARAASALVHPNIAAVYDCGECDGSPYVVMELVPGKSLAEELRSGPLAPQRAVSIAIEAAEALAEAHRHGIVHCDIKPSNIVLGDRGQVKVLDFGIARRFAPLARGAAAGTEPTTTLEGHVAGTPAYMAPDQVRGQPGDPRADLFSLGAVLYECLTGRRAFEGGTPIECIAKVLQHSPPAPSSIRPEVPRRLDGVVAKALAKEPDERYASASDFIIDLRSASVRPAAFISRRKVAASALGACALLPLVWSLWPSPPHQPKVEARRFYEEGVAAMADGTYFKAARALEQATRIDPDYTLAHAHLADAWSELDYSGRAQSAMLSALPPGQSSRRLSRYDLLHVQAIHRVLTRDYTGAAAIYRDLLNRTTDDAERVRVQLDLGRVYERSDRLKPALEVYRSVIQRHPENAAAHLRAGVVYRRMRDMPAAGESLSRAESLYGALSNLEGVTEALYQRSIIANQSSRYADAVSLLEQASRMAQASGNEHQQVTVLLQLSGVSSRQARLADARRHAGDALDRAHRNGLDDLAARSLLELGAIAQYGGDAQEAKRRFADALSVAQRHGGRRTEARARFSLASVRVDLGETAAALADLAPALAFYRAGGYASELSRCNIVQGRVFRNQGDYEGAREIAQAELEVGRRTPDPVLAHWALDLAASISLAQERYSEALRLYTDASEAGRAKGNAVTEHWALASCGDVLWRLGRYDEARRVLATVELFATSTGSTALLASVEMARAELALSTMKAGEAERRAAQVSRLAPEDRDLSAASSRVLAVAAARSGDRNAVRLADESLAAAQATGNASTVLAAQLARVEALLAAGEPAAAAQIARDLDEAASQRGQYDSSWRAHLLEQAALGAASRTPFRPAVADPGDAFTRLRESMSPDDFNSYMNRPDLRRLSRQTPRLIAGKQ